MYQNYRMNTLYDEDNRDIEEEMYLNDIAEEQYFLENPEEDEFGEKEEDDLGKEPEPEYTDISTAKKKEKVRNIDISERYLEEQLKINIETYRDNLRFKYNDVIYIGKVVHKLRDGVYIFAVHTEETEENVLKQFKCSGIKKAS